VPRSLTRLRPALSHRLGLSLVLYRSHLSNQALARRLTTPRSSITREYPVQHDNGPAPRTHHDETSLSTLEILPGVHLAVLTVRFIGVRSVCVDRFTGLPFLLRK
jgi:hypothetical protein